jgi:hypothetical protein
MITVPNQREYRRVGDGTVSDVYTINDAYSSDA